MPVSRYAISFMLLLGLGLVAAPSAAHAEFDVAVSFDIFAPPPVAIAPPPLPVYVVPAPPMEGYIWTPGHWRWGYGGYFWVPGTWVQPPVVGVLWTPGYWGWRDGVFAWNEGYWAPHVGFYGGINYGGGYDGHSFGGGEWHGGVYNVNRSVTNVTNITNVTNNYDSHNASFSGGPGGTTAVPTEQERQVMEEKHIAPTHEQVEHVAQASQNRALAASANHGRPAIAATAHPGDFSHGVVAARQAGAPNPEAQQHNAQVRQNPELAHEAAMPRVQARPAHQGGQPQQTMHPQNQAVHPQPQHVQLQHVQVSHPQSHPQQHPQMRPESAGEPRAEPQEHAHSAEGGGEHERQGEHPPQ